jgi:hypothetical protein
VSLLFDAKKGKMSTSRSSRKWRLRPHHLFCEQFSPWSLPERGKLFNGFERKLRVMLRSGTTSIIEVTEGADDLCQVCPICRNNRCQSPEGDEDAVRKWDAIVLRGLGIFYGDHMTAETLRAVVNEKAPLVFCRDRCKSKERCGVFR